MLARMSGNEGMICCAAQDWARWEWCKNGFQWSHIWNRKPVVVWRQLSDLQLMWVHLVNMLRCAGMVWFLQYGCLLSGCIVNDTWENQVLKNTNSAIEMEWTEVQIKYKMKLQKFKRMYIRVMHVFKIQSIPLILFSQTLTRIFQIPPHSSNLFSTKV